MKTSKLIEKWHSISTVKQSRRSVFELTDGLYWPKQLSPLVQRFDGWTSGEIELILLQNCYRFLQDSIQIETDTVNAHLARFVTGQTSLQFTIFEQAELLQVVADEAYHALNSLDLFAAIQVHTKIAPLMRIPETGRSYALNKLCQLVPKHLYDVFLFGIISIAENTITDELLLITSQSDVNKNIHLFMVEHLKDEGRHSKLFERIFKEKLKNLNAIDCKVLLDLLTQFSFHMLSESVARDADKILLESFINDSERIDVILNTVYPAKIEEDIFTNNTIGIRLTHFLERVFSDSLI
ncbi:MAG: diiron oxygenase [Bacteriovorax sp.]|nr:diiron oxygenase [Bacteriovorax sp.]